MANRGWQINPANIQEPYQRIKFLGPTWAGAICGIPQVKETAVLAYPWNKAKSSEPGLIAQIWRTHIPHLEILLAPNHKSTQKRIIFEWETETIRRCLNCNKQWLSQWSEALGSTFRYDFAFIQTGAYGKSP